MRDNPPADILRARAALHHLDSGCDRETWVKIGMAAKAAGLEFSDFLLWSKDAPNFKDRADCKAVWNSFKPGTVTAATLFKMAKYAGCTDRIKDYAGRAQSRQNERKESPPLHDAKALWNACKPVTASYEYIYLNL